MGRIVRLGDKTYVTTIRRNINTDLVYEFMYNNQGLIAGGFMVERNKQ